MDPHPFPYLIPVAAKYGKNDVQVRHLQEKIIDALEAHELSELAAVYRELERREDSYPLSRWIDEKCDDAIHGDRRKAMMLVFLFEGLARRGIEPFARRTAGYIEKHVVLNWAKLPPELAYLAEPAEKYGKHQFHEQIVAFLERMTEEEYEELRLVNSRTINDSDKIDAFLDRYRLSEHKEAALVYFLIGLLDGIRFDSTE